MEIFGSDYEGAAVLMDVISMTAVTLIIWDVKRCGRVTTGAEK